MSFTYEYSQPDDYHFSLDSIEAPRFIAAKILQLKNLEELQVLDLCAGCGVMGFELSAHIPKLRRIDFVEVQEVYLVHFEKNRRIVNRQELQLNFYLQNYDQIQVAEFKAKYDILLCNPPYFRPDQGKLSPSEFKNRCRFFIDSTFSKLIEAILWSLKPGGQAFLLLRELDDHGRTVMTELHSILHGRAQAQILTDIRGTHLVGINLTQAQKASVP